MKISVTFMCFRESNSDHGNSYNPVLYSSTLVLSAMLLVLLLHNLSMLCYVCYVLILQARQQACCGSHCLYGLYNCFHVWTTMMTITWHIRTWKLYCLTSTKLHVNLTSCVPLMLRISDGILELYVRYCIAGITDGVLIWWSGEKVQLMNFYFDEMICCSIVYTVYNELKIMTNCNDFVSSS